MNLLCIHRGTKLRDAKCELCGGRRNEPVFICALHGECTLRKYKVGQKIKNCLDCGDRDEGDRKDADPPKARKTGRGVRPSPVRRVYRPRRRASTNDVGNKKLPTGGLSTVDVGAVRVLRDGGAEAFQEVYCISLDRRPDRWQAFCEDFPEDWPYRAPQRYSAVDGKKEKPPSWWRQGGGAWGCYQSHIRILDSCVRRGVESVLIFEDDAVPCENAVEMMREAMNHLPLSSTMIYLGGQLLMQKRHEPVVINSHWMTPYNVNRTHAYALRGDGIKTMLEHLNNTEGWQKKHHIDHHYGRYHQRMLGDVVVPTQWFFGQREGLSNINGRIFERRFWSQPGGGPPAVNPPVFVVGLHSSGSSVVAGILHRLGVYMGRDFRGAWDGGHEDDRLARLCESIMPFPNIRIRTKDKVIKERLLSWWRSKELERPKLQFSRVGAKYPHLCALNVGIPPSALIVDCDRPLEESISSLQRRCPKRDPEKLRELQEHLWERKTELFSRRPPRFTVRHFELLKEPHRVVSELSDALGLKASKERVLQAVEYVKQPCTRV
jgi:GR25 family glycosyltransferase involved in LPS biosynthesis